MLLMLPVALDLFSFVFLLLTLPVALDLFSFVFLLASRDCADAVVFMMIPDYIFFFFF